MQYFKVQYLVIVYCKQQKLGQRPRLGNEASAYLHTDKCVVKKHEVLWHTLLGLQ